jgi:hypothetical protein
MRHALILLASVSLLAAQDAEVLTMKDGRVLTGYVLPMGPHRARLELVDPQGAVITISLDEVATREPYVAPPPHKARGAPSVPHPERITVDPELFSPRRSRFASCEDLGGTWSGESAVERAL